MRLSSVLSDATTNRLYEVEPFMGKTIARWGTHRRIEVGTVTRSYECKKCQSVRPFNSRGQLSCLIAGPNLVSVDVVLKCVDCDTSVENWFLVRCADDLFGSAPSVSLIQVSEHLGDSAQRSRPYDGKLEELIDRADVAYACGLGAGSFVYLRKCFEIVTHQAATKAGVELTRKNGGRRSFAEVLTEVDKHRRIIPTEFSQDGYRLFSEISELLHGDASESDALQKYSSLKRLVRGVVDNVRNTAELSEAKRNLKW